MSIKGRGEKRFWEEAGQKLCFMLSLCFWPSLSQGADIGLSARAMGMGNAYTALVDNGDAVFYNPAGLAKMSGFNWTIVDPSVGTDTYKSYQRYIDIAKDSNDVAKFINALYGESIPVFSNAKSLFSFGSFAFGAYGVADGNFLINNSVFPNIETSYRLDQGFVMGAGFKLIPDRLHMGLQARRVVRRGANFPVGVSTIATLDQEAINAQLNNSGRAYAFDWGLNLQFPGSLKPVLAFTWRDVGDTHFRPRNGEVTNLAPVEQEQILGWGLTYETLLLDIRTSLDYRFLTDDNRPLERKINMGLELSWPLLDIRAGFHEGYHTLGASFDLWLMRVDAATYGVELGEYAGQLEERRYMVQISLDFGIDPKSFAFFKLSRPSLKNHGRKLRR